MAQKGRLREKLMKFAFLMNKPKQNKMRKIRGTDTLQVVDQATSFWFLLGSVSFNDVC